MDRSAAIGGRQTATKKVGPVRDVPNPETFDRAGVDFHAVLPRQETPGYSMLEMTLATGMYSPREIKSIGRSSFRETFGRISQTLIASG